MREIKRFVFIYSSDPTVRVNLSLSISLVTNFCYIVFNLVSGISYSSVWFVSAAAYYLLIVLARYIIIDASSEGELEIYKACKRVGSLILTMTIPVAGVIFYVSAIKSPAKYSRFILLILLCYSIYSLTRSVIGLFAGRGRGGAINRAASTIRFSAALMSLFNLQSAAIPYYGITGEASFFTSLLTGFFVSGAISFLAIRTISESKREIKKHSKNGEAL